MAAQTGSISRQHHATQLALCVTSRGLQLEARSSDVGKAFAREDRQLASTAANQGRDIYRLHMSRDFGLVWSTAICVSRQESRHRTLV
jgi:hypothetical protein